MLPTPPPPRPLRSPTRPGRPYPADIVAGVRALVEGAGLPYREAAARSGVSVHTVGLWARRFGWRRAGAGGARARALGKPGPLRNSHVASAGGVPPPPGFARFPSPCGGGDPTGAASSPPPMGEWDRPKGGGGGAGSRPRRARGYGPEVREAARVRVEGTRDSLERIGLELGIDRTTVQLWRKRFGWRRPAPPDRVGPTFYRSRRFGRPYGGDAVGTARDLWTGTTLTADRIAARAGVSRATLYRWAKRPGWTRYQVAGATGPVSRRYRPADGPEVVAAARELFQATELSTRFIAARVGATPDRVGRWARREGWTRPHRSPPAWPSRPRRLRPAATVTPRLRQL